MAQAARWLPLAKVADNGALLIMSKVLATEDEAQPYDGAAVATPAGPGEPPAAAQAEAPVEARQAAAQAEALNWREKYGLQQPEARDSFDDDEFFDPDAPAYHEAPGICGCDVCMCIVACNYDKSDPRSCHHGVLFESGEGFVNASICKALNLARLGCCGAAPANAVMIRAPPSVAKAIRVFDKTGVASIMSLYKE